MHVRLILAAILAPALVWGVGAARPTAPAPATTPAPADEGLAFEVRMADDSVVKVVLLDPTIALATRYGKLVVPVAEVRRIEPGFRFPDGSEAKVEKAIEGLASPVFAEREEAEQLLVKLEHASVPALRRAVKSGNPEVSKRALAVLRILEGKLPPELMSVRDYDVIETAEFTARGRIEGGRLKVRTRYFGEATLHLVTIHGLRSVAGGGGSEIALDAANYAKVNGLNWLETTITVQDGQELEIAASGQIDLWPMQPGMYMSGPTGSGGGPGGFAPGGPRVGLSGQPIGRIGANGTPFVIGAGYKGKASGSGKLYLRISPSQWGNDSSGSYKLKVNAGG